MQISCQILLEGTECTPYDIIYLKLHFFPFFLSLFVLMLIMFLTLFPVEGELYSFGRGEFGQLGLGTLLFLADTPVAVGHFKKGRVTHVTCGENHSALITGKICTLLN